MAKLDPESDPAGVSSPTSGAVVPGSGHLLPVSAAAAVPAEPAAARSSGLPSTDPHVAAAADVHVAAVEPPSTPTNAPPSVAPSVEEAAVLLEDDRI